ncbi:uncharacterized protein LOC117172445 [Belonocnema kinseyi]|uniref:uncharacterized protein LOC117172445 n=1 Tax=Belonocnema kinseyi TaxID=2817044 RepID=UPI00143D416F|nr:uncharacterized protein LOC117172445 [Belonocnema kinseyi]
MMKMKFKSEATPLVQTFVILSLINFSNGYIECYKCPIEATKTQEYIDCPSFDRSPIFKVQCFTSTFCEKKITHLTITNGTTITRVVHRGCAPQNEQQHHLRDREWVIRDNIKRYIYEPGCSKGIDKNSPTGPATYCRCTTHYCNGVSPKDIVQSLHISLVAIFILYLL